MSEVEQIIKGEKVIKLKASIHEHPLTLVDWLVNGENCNKCLYYVTGPTYTCNTCSTFFIHKSCVKLPPEICDPFHLNRQELREGGTVIKLKTFIHEHPLTLLDWLINGENCSECGLYITGPAYTCNTCNNFFIHKSCVELPSEIHHPFHPNHPLTLSSPPSPPTFNGFFFCELCHDVRNGFSYSCAECHYAMDPHCALNIPTTFLHVRHEHSLTLLVEDYNIRCAECNALTYVWYKCTMPDCGYTVLDFNCAFLPPTGKHKSHRHQLKLKFLPSNGDDPFNQPEDYCDACETNRWPNGCFYCCEKCENFVAHRRCIASPVQLIPPTKSSLTTLKDPLHEHVLTLQPIASPFRRGLEYHCKDCHYKVDVRYVTKLPVTRQLAEAAKLTTKAAKARKPPKEAVIRSRKTEREEREMEIQHFSHHHPLRFSEVIEWNNERCNICRLSISGANYSCSINNCKFYLHDICTDTPKEIQHELHTNISDHPLSLAQSPSPRYLNNVFVCDICSAPGDGFSYHCYKCNCVYHVDCVLDKPYSLAHRCHKHRLNLTKIWFNLPCCACAKEVDTVAYHCWRCKVSVHVQCALLPTTLNHESHIHSLILSTEVQGRFHCGVCGNKGRECEGWGYSCDDCEFIAHISCVHKGDPSPYIKLGETLKHQSHEHPLSLTLRSHEYMSRCSHCHKLIESNLSYQCTKCNFNLDLHCASRLTYAKPLSWVPKEEESEEKAEGALEREHISHQHPLALLDEQTVGKRCNACRLTMSSAIPSYGCINCKFLLHKSCLELPRKIVSPFHHEHPLILSTGTSQHYYNGIFHCFLCQTPGDGFSFTCPECPNIYHVQCALLTPSEIRHECHEHLLPLRWIIYELDSKCAACKRSCGSGWVFYCSECDFALHVLCALQILPQTLKHKSHRHDFTLLYTYDEEESDEYYCDACEEEREPGAWVYCCKKCQLFAHTSCIRDAEPFPFIELGGSRKIESHEHPVTFFVRENDINRKNGSTYLSGLHLECTECNYNIDFFETPVRTTFNGYIPFGALCWKATQHW